MGNFTTFYVVRHGETEWNRQGVLQGHADIPLNKTGENQAKEVGEKFMHVRFDAVFSSDLLRAKKTAEGILLEKKMAITTSHLLRERTYGKYEGMKRDEYRQLLKKQIEDFEKLSEEEKFKFRLDDEVESDEEIVSRVFTFLREVAVGYQGKNILITSHGGVMRALLIHLGFGTQNQLHGFAVKNGAYIKLQCDGVEFKLLETHNIEKNNE